MAETLLLADDNPTMQRVVQLTCAEHGFEVVSVSDGQEAIDYLLIHRPALALISVTLQQLDGFEVARAVRDRPELRGLPVLLVAGAFDVIDEARVRESGAAGLLVKPFEPGLLIKRVKELLGMSKPEISSDPAPSAQSGRLVTTAEPPPRTPDAAPSSSDESGAGVDTATRGEHDIGEHAAFDSLDAQLPDRTAPPRPPLASPAPDAAPARQHTETPVFDGADFGEFATREPGAPGAGDWRHLRRDTPSPSAYGASFEPERTESARDEDAAPVAPAAAPAVAADAFAMLWAHEQGEPLPPLPAPPPLELSDQTVDAVAERMTARLAGRVTDSLAARLTDGLTPRVTDGLASRVTDDLAGRLTGSLADRMTDAVAARVSTGLAEQIATQLAERVMQNAFGDSLRQTVHDVSERLVREEIARIRAAAKDSPRS